MKNENKKNIRQESSQPKRPQEPLRPYPYREEEVAYQNNAAGVTLAGTLTLPQGPGPFPAVIVVAGAGPHKRDATVYRHKTMLVLADCLTRQGIAVLRFDKRGCGDSTGNYTKATSADFASDVEAGIKYMKSRKEINSKQIGLIGHSEGGIIASMVTATSPDLAFVVMLACPAVNGEEILYEQCAGLARGMGEAESAIAMQHELLVKLCAIIKSESDIKAAEKKVDAICTKYLMGLSETEKKVYENSILREIFELMNDLSWLRFYITFEPASVLKKVKVPLLAFFCERDLLVPANQNILPFKKALEAAGNNETTILLMPELNHRFMHCKIGTEREYADIEETLAPEVLKIISEWLLDLTIKKNLEVCRLQYPVVTQRLYLRPPVEEDTELLMAVFADPDVMKYSLTGCLSREQIREKIKEWQKEYRENGFCPFTIVRKQDNELIGICGLHVSSTYTIEEKHPTEITIRLAKKFWGSGYGFEAAQAVLQDACKKNQCKEIVAIVDVLNERSRKLVEKIGMHKWKQTTLLGILVDLYKYEN